MVGIPIGLLAANGIEWLVHKHLLHGLGRNKKSFWSFHWHEHHRNAHRHAFRDPTYERSVFGWHAQGKEAAALVGGCILSLPMLPFAPWLTMTLWYGGFNYYRRHKRAHCDPEWARRHLPWHYDHHMAPDAEANWCVTRPWFDVLLGTRRPYLGTPQETAERARRAAKRPELRNKSAI